MSKYTMELNEVIEHLQMLERDLFPPYEYPTYIEKDKLENMFVAHYYFREIGQETVPRFLQRFQTKWVEMLQEYNIKFKIISENLSSENALNNYNNVRQDTNTFKATPMSSLDPNKTYNTSITDVKGSSMGYQGNKNKFENIAGVLKEHNEIYNNFISEFENLFMEVL